MCRPQSLRYRQTVGQTDHRNLPRAARRVKVPANEARERAPSRAGICMEPEDKAQAAGAGQGPDRGRIGATGTAPS